MLRNSPEHGQSLCSELHTVFTKNSGWIVVHIPDHSQILD
jgi:hypothetical protein